MFNFLKQNKTKPQAEKAAPGVRVNKLSGHQTGAEAGEIKEDQLDRVSGGINPQPLPPRGGDDHLEFPIF